MNEQPPSRVKLLAALNGDYEIVRAIEDLFRRVDALEKKSDEGVEDSDEST